MSTGPDTPVALGRMRAADAWPVVARWLLAGLFLYMGLNKALHPFEFLKLVRQYDLLEPPFLLNLVAATLPWFEIFCGVLLLAGVAVRGAAVMLVAMLIPFSLVVLRRALAIHAAGELPFCAIQFDCGCGSGAVNICRKLTENVLLTALAIALVFRPGRRLGLRTMIFRAESARPSGRSR